MARRAEQIPVPSPYCKREVRNWMQSGDYVAMAQRKAARKSTARRGTVRKSTARKSTARKSVARKSAARKSTAPKSTARKSAARKTGRRWSGVVTRTSNALDLSRGVFTWTDPKRIAGSLKRSAERSKRRKADPYRSALSMLTFYLNRAGKNLQAGQRRVLRLAKDELRKQFGRG
jgi:hypothetical protein